eukprot:5249573-Karenia_brevis.AAC.1
MFPDEERACITCDTVKESENASLKLREPLLQMGLQLQYARDGINNIEMAERTNTEDAHTPQQDSKACDNDVGKTRKALENAQVEDAMLGMLIKNSEGTMSGKNGQHADHLESEVPKDH